MKHSLVQLLPLFIHQFNSNIHTIPYKVLIVTFRELPTTSLLI